VDRSREEAVALARAGDVAAAVDALERLHADAPESLPLRLDLAVISSWAGNDPRTLELLGDLEPGDLPTYVLETYARSARNQASWELSFDLYDRLIEREPHVLGHRLGLALAMADGGEAKAARRTLEEARAVAGDEPKDLAQVELVCGYVEERDGRFTRALVCYDDALALDPGLGEARRRWIMLASALGATVEAFEAAQANPEVLTPDDVVRLQLDAAAKRIRWADLPSPGAPLADAEMAVDGHDVVAKGGEPARVAGSHRRALEYDRVVSHSAAYRMVEAIDLFESLQGTPGDLEGFPSYVLAAAGRAYLYEEHTRDAIACFEQALGLDPNAFNLRIGLFYALSDHGDFEGAKEVAEHLIAGEEPFARPDPRVWVPNDRYATARVIAARELAYRERYTEALNDLDEMLAIAPANTGVRLTRAQLLQWRGWNEQAEREVVRIQTTDPTNVGVKVLSGTVALEKQQYPRAEREVNRALRSQPYDKSAIELNERWLLHNSGYFEASASAERSEGSAFAGESWRTDVHYYSSPIAYRYRWFVHDAIRHGKFTEGTGKDHRIGAGVDFRSNRWSARGEVHKGLEQNRKAGVTASASWRQSDRLTWDSLVSYNTMGMPLRGTRVGIRADEAQGGATYRWHESRRAYARAGLMKMDDGNDRKWLDSGFEQRVVNAPRQKLLVNLGAYTSRNSGGDRVYYNPETDYQITAGLTHEWRLMRRYQQSFVQRLSVDGGEYHQKGFGGGPIWTLRLEHDWQIGRRVGMSWGATWGGRRYDGEREHVTTVFLTFRGHL
jgi:poly-beta-1,6 N-acetyl-D-glucosamine export porin PgaA